MGCAQVKFVTVKTKAVRNAVTRTAAPLPLPRPSGDEARVFTVRSPGYVETQVRIAADSPESITAQLEAERVRRPVGRRPRPSVMSSSEMMSASPPPSMRRRRSEVVDPWAD